MARVAGVDIPDNKRGEVSLTYIFGIGRSLSRRVLREADLDMNKRVRDWTDDEAGRVRKIIGEACKVEGVLKAEQQMNIKRLMDIGCYIGQRHRKRLPVRGQKTKNNCRTLKGKAQTITNKRKAARK